MSNVYSKNFILANSIEEQIISQNHVVFSIYPLEPGFGTTIGNCIRRVLVSGIDGVCISSIEIGGVNCRIGNIAGVYEDIPEIIYNCRNIILKTDLSFGFLNLKVKGPRVVKASDISLIEGVELINPDAVLFEITGDNLIDMSLEFKRGIGIKFIDFSSTIEKEIGKLELDTNFSPVVNVSFKTEDVRVGDKISYEKLLIDIKTNGSCSARSALDKAIAILIDNLSKISSLRTVFDVDGDKGTSETCKGKYLYNPNVFKVLEDMEISVRSLNALSSMGCVYLGDLVVTLEEKVLSTPNLGKKSCDEINKLLIGASLSYDHEMPWITNGKLSEEEFNRLKAIADEHFRRRGDDVKLSPSDFIC